MQTIFTLKQQVLNGEVITVPVQNSSNISTYSYNPQTKIFSVLAIKVLQISSLL